MTYELLDSGHQRKWEKWGSHKIIRPCAQAVWAPSLDSWTGAEFTREGGWRGKLPKEWKLTLDGLEFLIRPTDFGHLGLFPEHPFEFPSGKRALNLFAYTGRASLHLAKAGFDVTHVDASKKSVAWARENANLNGIENVRWIIEDARKFLAREKRRESFYDLILLDPPSFGRGARGEVFKVEEEILPLLEQVRDVLDPSGGHVLLTSHTPGWTPEVLSNLLQSSIGGEIEAKELLIKGQTLPLPSGSMAIVQRAKIR